MILVYILLRMEDIPIKRAGDILKNILDGKNLIECRIYSDIFNTWRSIAGEKLACHSKIRDIRNNILIVEAEHPSWIQLIRIKESAILKIINKKYPNLHIYGISICQGDTFPIKEEAYVTTSENQDTFQNEEQNDDKIYQIDLLKELEKLKTAIFSQKQ
jgi:hypothetical protein